MIYLAIQQLRRRALRYASLLFAIFASVALTVAATALTLSVINNVNHLFTKSYEEADFVISVTAEDESSTDLMKRQLVSLPGVEALTYRQNSLAFLRLPDGIYEDTLVQTIESGPLQWRSVVEGIVPQGPGEIAVTESAGSPRVGAQVSLRTASDVNDVVLTVVGHMEATAEEVMSGTSTVLIPPQTMSEWGLNTTRGEFLLSADGVSREEIAQAVSIAGTTSSVSTADVHADSLADSYLNSRDRYFLLLFVFVLVAAAVAFLVVFSSYSVIAGERIREVGLIRSIGASTSQVIGSAVMESLLLGLIASGLGVPAGLFVARLLAQEATYFGVRFPIENVSAPTELLFLILGVGIVMPVLAALPATISTTRQSTIEALTSSSAIRSNPMSIVLWWLLTLTLGGIGGWLLSYRGQFIGDQFLLLTLAAAGSIVLTVLLFLALILPSVVQTVSRFLGSLPIPTIQLGMAFAGRQKIRAAALVAIIVAGSALISAVIHGQNQIREHLLSTAASMGGTDLRVTALDGEIPRALSDELSELPGVSEAIAPGTTIIEFADAGAVTAVVLDDATGATILRGQDTGAPPGTVVLGKSSGLQHLLPAGTNVAAEIGGATLTVDIRHTRNSATLVHPNLVQRARESVAADIGISPEDLPQQPIRSLMILLKGPAHQDAHSPVIDEIREIIAAYPGRYSFTEGFTARNSTLDLTNRISTMSTLLALVALIIATIGLSNTIVLTVAERSRDRALLRAIGLPRSGQVLVTLTEMLTLILPSAFVGAMVGEHLGNHVAEVAVSGRSVPLADLRHLDGELILLITLAMTLGGMLCALLVLGRSMRGS